MKCTTIAVELVEYFAVVVHECRQQDLLHRCQLKLLVVLMSVVSETTW